MYLKIENISKIFEKERGVKNISFQLEKGELVSFLGPSGCGKTTLLNIIGGFVKNDSGSIYLEDKDITEYPPEKRDCNSISKLCTFSSYECSRECKIWAKI